MTMQVKIDNCDAPGTVGRKLRIIPIEGGKELPATFVTVGPGESYSTYLYDARSVRLEEIKDVP